MDRLAQSLQVVPDHERLLPDAFFDRNRVLHSPDRDSDSGFNGTRNALTTGQTSISLQTGGLELENALENARGHTHCQRPPAFES